MTESYEGIDIFFVMSLNGYDLYKRYKYRYYNKPKYVLFKNDLYVKDFKDMREARNFMKNALNRQGD